MGEARTFRFPKAGAFVWGVVMITVLIAEDEESLRLAVADFLRCRGFAVIETKTAAEAIAVLETETAVDLLFSDVNMPGSMDGFELTHWIQRHRPGVPILLTSGRPNALQAGVVANQVVSFLPKPYSPASAEQMIRQLCSVPGRPA